MRESRDMKLEIVDALSDDHLFFKKAGQPLDQSLANHNFIDDFTLFVNQVGGITSVGISIGPGRWVQKANFYQVLVESLLGEFLPGPRRHATFFGCIDVCVYRIPEPDEGVGDHGTFIGIATTADGVANEEHQVFAEVGHHGFSPSLSSPENHQTLLGTTSSS
jgi:hypothetical protein